MERPVPPETGAVEPDRDVAALEQAEHDLAELERELRRIDGAEEPRDA